MNEKTISVESHSMAMLYNKLTKDDENIMSYHKCSYFHLVNTEHSNLLTTDLIEMFECLGINIVKDTFSYTSHRTKGETIHRMYRNRDYFWDGSVHDTWRPAAYDTNDIMLIF